MTFWSSQTLAKELPTLISPCNPNRIEQASYTLRIGKEIFVTKDQNNNDSHHTKRTLSEKQAFVIPSGQFAFLLTEETVTVPNDAIAFISMKAGFKYKRLINISGFHVDPGFKGKLLFSVYNAGPSPIHLEHKANCFLIWYSNLDEVDSKPRTKQGFSEFPLEILNKIPENEIYSMRTLTTKILSIENQHNSILHWIGFIKWTGRILLGFIIIAASFIISKKDTINDYYKALNNIVHEQKKSAQELNINTPIDETKKQLKPKT